MNVRKTERIAYILKDITEYGKFVAYCIDHDISVYRLYWNEQNKNRCYVIYPDMKLAGVANKDWCALAYSLKEPKFYLSKYGRWLIK